MRITRKEYQTARAVKHLQYYTISAKQAVQSIRHNQAIEQWRNAIGAPKRLYTDNNNIAHSFTIAGHSVRLCIELDEYNYRYEDIFPRKGGMNSQGYEVHALGRYDDVDQSPRYKNGQGLTVFKRVNADRDSYKYKFYLPESWIRQFYDNCNQSKADAHNNMIQSALSALDSDIETATSEYYTISCVVTDSHNNEIFSDYLGGCDYEYAVTGEAFFEHGMIESARAAIDDSLEKQAQAIMQSRPDMYQEAAQ